MAEDDESRKVTLVRDPQLGYGFTIRGGDNPGNIQTPIVISRLKPGAPAEKCSQLHIGDQILSINGTSLGNASHEAAVALLREATEMLDLVVKSINVDLRAAGPGKDAYTPGRHMSASRLFLAAVDYERVQILYNYKSTKKDELELLRGDIILVKGKGTDGWCIGENQRTKVTGFFPGNFAMKMRHTREELESIYAEVDRKYSVSPRPGSGMGGDNVYERLPGDEPTSPALLTPTISATGEPMYERVVRTRHQSDRVFEEDDSAEASSELIAAAAAAAGGGSGDGASAAPGDGDEQPTSPSVDNGSLPSVAKLVGNFGGSEKGNFQVKLIGVVEHDQQQQSPTAATAPPDTHSPPPSQPVTAAAAAADANVAVEDKSKSLPPLPTGDSGEIIYAPVRKQTPAEGENSTGSSVGEIIYAPIKKSKHQERVLTGEVYASISKAEDASAQAPTVPARGYDKNLLPPTVHVQMNDTVDDLTYEVLPSSYHQSKETSDTGEVAYSSGSLLYEDLPEIRLEPLQEESTFKTRSSTRSVGGSIPPELPPMDRRPSSHTLTPAEKRKDEKRRAKETAKRAKEEAKRKKTEAKKEKAEAKRLKKLAKKNGSKTSVTSASSIESQDQTTRQLENAAAAAAKPDGTAH